MRRSWVCCATAAAALVATPAAESGDAASLAAAVDDVAAACDGERFVHVYRAAGGDAAEVAWLPPCACVVTARLGAEAAHAVEAAAAAPGVVAVAGAGAGAVARELHARGFHVLVAELAHASAVAQVHIAAEHDGCATHVAPFAEAAAFRPRDAFSAAVLRRWATDAADAQDGAADAQGAALGSELAAALASVSGEWDVVEPRRVCLLELHLTSYAFEVDGAVRNIGYAPRAAEATLLAHARSFFEPLALVGGGCVLEADSAGCLAGALVGAIQAVPSQQRPLRSSVAVVFSGAARAFAARSVRENVLRRALVPLCAAAWCDVFMLITAENLEAAGTQRPGSAAADVFALLAADGGWGIFGARHAATRVRTRRCADAPAAPDAPRTRGLFDAKLAWSLVVAEEVARGYEYEFVLRMRFDAVWMRPPSGVAEIVGVCAVCVVSPRHDFPLNDHFAAMTRSAADAYFAQPLEVAQGWRAPAVLDNAQGVLLKALLLDGVEVRREPLFLTLYRPFEAQSPGGAECSRFLAYAASDRGVAEECRCLFPEVDSAARWPGKACDGETCDGEACDGGGAGASADCRARGDALEADVVADARRKRHMLWADSVMSLAQLASLEISSLDDWRICEAKWEEYYAGDVPGLAYEVQHDGTGRSCGDEGKYCAPLRAEVATRSGNASVRVFDVLVESAAVIGFKVEALCSLAAIADSDCARLHAAVQTDWALGRPQCTADADDARQTRGSDGDDGHAFLPARNPVFFQPDDASDDASDSALGDPSDEAGPVDRRGAEESAADQELADAPSAFDGLFSFEDGAAGNTSLIERKAARLLSYKTALGMEWRPPALGVPERTARAVTKVWRRLGITQRQTDNAASADDCVLLQILGAAAYVDAPPHKVAAWAKSPPWRERRRNAAVDVVLKAAPSLGTDVEVVFCPTDCVTAAKPMPKGGTYYGVPEGASPALTLVGCAGSHSVPFPVFDARSNDLNESLANWDGAMDTYLLPLRGIQIEEKRAVFRGATLGRTCWSGDAAKTLRNVDGYVDGQTAEVQPGLCGRRLLRAVAASAPRRFDVGYDHVPFLQQCRWYKYHVYVGGHCGWSDRLRLLLHAPVVVFLQETYCREFFALGLEPWVHYLPLDYDFANLIELHAWAEAHAEEVQRIIRNANAYADSVVREAPARAYALSVLRGLSQALRYAPMKASNALPAQRFLDERRWNYTDPRPG
ncbi:glycosyl transferase family 90-domain-containing protein [Pelagophyceae sp. CCMP2097]|nr:glycosyl transferase family 90-domain-containing protein [Pelagophyceae sp. CCMP2097]